MAAAVTRSDAGGFYGRPALIGTEMKMHKSDNTDEIDVLFGLPNEASHERIIFGRHSSGLRCIIAIHNTTRGPAFGGCRFWRYESDHAALVDALRLSQGMSFKNALANLPFGGGKSVIIAPQGSFDRNQLFSAFGELVDSANGKYITAEDVGTTTADMSIVAGHTKYVSGLQRRSGFGGDPSPKTAWGVFLAMERGLKIHLKKSVSNATVAIQGLGSVGMALCEYLADRGARLIVADVNEARTAEAAARLGARVVPVHEILQIEADVLAPCALGAVLNEQSIPRLRAAIVAGAANNQLARAEDGDALHARGILYLPDFLINAGGIISVAREYLCTGDDGGEVAREVAKIADRVAELLERCGDGEPPARAAESWARGKLCLRSMAS